MRDSALKTPALAAMQQVASVDCDSEQSGPDDKSTAANISRNVQIAKDHQLLSAERGNAVTSSPYELRRLHGVWRRRAVATNGIRTPARPVSKRFAPPSSRGE